MNNPIMIIFYTNKFGTFSQHKKTYQLEKILEEDIFLPSHHKHNKINIYQYFA